MDVLPYSFSYVYRKYSEWEWMEVDTCLQKRKSTIKAANLPLRGSLDDTCEGKPLDLRDRHVRKLSLRNKDARYWDEIKAQVCQEQLRALKKQKELLYSSKVGLIEENPLKQIKRFATYISNESIPLAERLDFYKQCCEFDVPLEVKQQLADMLADQLSRCTALCILENRDKNEGAFSECSRLAFDLRMSFKLLRHRYINEEVMNSLLKILVSLVGNSFDKWHYVDSGDSIRKDAISFLLRNIKNPSLDEETASYVLDVILENKRLRGEVASELKDFLVKDDRLLSHAIMSKAVHFIDEAESQELALFLLRRFARTREPELTQTIFVGQRFNAINKLFDLGLWRGEGLAFIVKEFYGPTRYGFFVKVEAARLICLVNELPRHYQGTKNKAIAFLQDIVAATGVFARENLDTRVLAAKTLLLTGENEAFAINALLRMGRGSEVPIFVADEIARLLLNKPEYRVYGIDAYYDFFIQKACRLNHCHTSGMMTQWVAVIRDMLESPTYCDKGKRIVFFYASHTGNINAKLRREVLYAFKELYGWCIEDVLRLYFNNQSINIWEKIQGFEPMEDLIQYKSLYSLFGELLSKEAMPFFNEKFCVDYHYSKFGLLCKFAYHLADAGVMTHDFVNNWVNRCIDKRFSVLDFKHLQQCRFAGTERVRVIVRDIGLRYALEGLTQLTKYKGETFQFLYGLFKRQYESKLTRDFLKKEISYEDAVTAVMARIEEKMIGEMEKDVFFERYYELLSEESVRKRCLGVFQYLAETQNEALLVDGIQMLNYAACGERGIGHTFNLLEELVEKDFYTKDALASVCLAVRQYIQEKIKGCSTITFYVEEKYCGSLPSSRQLYGRCRESDSLARQAFLNDFMQLKMETCFYKNVFSETRYFMRDYANGMGNGSHGGEIMPTELLKDVIATINKSELIRHISSLCSMTEEEAKEALTQVIKA